MIEVKKSAVFTIVMSANGQGFGFEMKAESQEAACRDLFDKLTIICKELQTEMNKPKSQVKEN